MSSPAEELKSSTETGTSSASPSTQLPPSETSVPKQAQLAPSFRTLSPDASDRIFPVRSLVNVEPQPACLHSPGAGSSSSAHGTVSRQSSVVGTPVIEDSYFGLSRSGLSPGPWRNPTMSSSTSDSTRDPVGGEEANSASRPDEAPPAPAFVTARHRHVLSEDGHMIIAGIDGMESMQRCEDEPIHIPGAVQGFGCLVALRDNPEEGILDVRVVSEVCSPARASVYLQSKVSN